MAERDPPNTNTINTNPDDDHVPVLHNTEDPEPNFRSGTYVVQVPKDQIYRVPPPENALIVERHGNPEKKKRAPCCSCFLCCFITIAIVVLILGLIAGISAYFLKPKHPSFSLERILVKNQTSHKHPEYDITLKVENPNRISSILYKQDGVSSLSFQQQKIATGSYPTFYQERGNSTNIVIVLNGSNIVLPKEIDQSMKTQNKKLNVSMSLKITVPINTKTGIFSAGNIKIVATCNFMVDTLAKGSRILSQQCQTKKQP